MFFVAWCCSYGTAASQEDASSSARGRVLRYLAPSDLRPSIARAEDRDGQALVSFTDFEGQRHQPVD